MRLLTLSIFLVLGGAFAEVPAKTSPEANPHRDDHGTSIRVAAFRHCLQQAGLGREKLVTRDLDSDWYRHLNLQWNLRKETVYPAYFLPNFAVDVARAVRCGLTTHIRVIPNSGGHSYEGIGWGNNHTVVVDFRNMKGIQVVGSGRNAIGVVEPGALVGPINAYFWENGGYAVPMGNCLTIGMGGHAIGGGVGYFAPMYGLTLDNILEVEMVDGRGSILRASNSKNKELFWALRGVGPGYIGIVTRLKLKLFQASENKYTLLRKAYPVQDFAKVYIAFQNMLNWIKHNEPEIFLVLMLASDTYNASLPPLPPGIVVSGFHIQDPVLHPQGNSSFLTAMNEIFPPPTQDNAFFLNYIQFVALTGYAPVIFPNSTAAVAHSIRKRQAPSPQLPSDPEILATFNSLTKDIAAPRYFKAKSFFIKKEFNLAEMEQVGKVLAGIPQNNVWILLNSELGAVHRVGRNETAYNHRNDLFDITIHYEGSPLEADVSVGMKFLYELWDTIQFMDGGETYQNYPDLDIRNHLERNYDGNLWRLMEEKRRRDPRNYFVSPLSLPINTRRV